MVNWVQEGIGVIESAVNIGIVNKPESSFLIDTGIDNSAINKVLKIIDFDIDGALITHHHADHMGGCAKLESLGIDKLYGPKEELEFFTNPLIEPFTMFGGSYPPKKLRNRHLEAKASKEIKSADDNIFGKQILCPGHTPAHTAYLVDDILFSGDAAFTSETIEKYKLLFAVNPKIAAESLDILENTHFSVMIPGHGHICHDKKSAIDVLRVTKEHYQSIRETVLTVIGEKMIYTDLIPEMMKELKIDEIVSARGVTQYFLYQVPLMGYLGNLMDDKLVSLEVLNNALTIVST